MFMQLRSLLYHYPPLSIRSLHCYSAVTNVWYTLFYEVSIYMRYTTLAVSFYS
jgi:hypothetical protein